jgi:hypothetical protein
MALTVFAGVSAAAQRKPGVARPVPVDVQAACGAAYTIAAKTPGVVVKRSTGTFRDETLSRPVSGCGLALTGSFAKADKSGDATIRLRQDFEARGWAEMGAYSADGTDGTSFAFRRAGVACLVRGTWDGGADGDPPLPAEDWYKVALFCTTPVFPETR